MKIKGEDAVIRQLETRFSGHHHGVSNAVSQEAVTGKRRSTPDIESTARTKRESTEEATVESMQKPGPVKQAGTKRKGRKTKKSIDAENWLPLLYDIALPDGEQPTRSLEFLHDQRTERKCRLPPVTGMLGIERRRRDKEAKEEERRTRESLESCGRFNTVGP